MEILTAILNIFVVPSIATAGCYRRMLIKPQTPVWLDYLQTTAILYFIQTVELKLIQIIFSWTLAPSADFYTILAVIHSFCYPYAREFLQKYFAVEVTFNG